jgi:predicted small lipoprotein YifL
MTFVRLNAMIDASTKLTVIIRYSLPMFNLKVMRLIIVAGTLGFIAACGQKGPLELPPPAEQNQPTNPAENGE